MPGLPRLLSTVERAAMMGAACRKVVAAGLVPPFRLRPGLIAEILTFYDELQRNLRSVDAFERLTLDALEPNVDIDRGAARLAVQTRFLVAAFRLFDQASVATGALDEHHLRTRTLATAVERPWRHVVIAAGDRASSPYGLWPCDFDLLARVPGLTRLDMVATETALTHGLEVRLHDVLPGCEHVRLPDAESLRGPVLLTRPELPDRSADSASPLVQVSRDREEEVAAFARRIKAEAHEPEAVPLDRIALLVRRPLPYVYLAREVLRSAGVPCQMLDTLPLASEPYAATLDLVLGCAASGGARPSLMGVLRSPHLTCGIHCSPASLHALDRRLSEAGHLGGEGALADLVAAWEADDSARLAARAGVIALEVVRLLAPLAGTQPAAAHLGALLDFLLAHDRVPQPDDALGGRHLRARAAILAGLSAMQEAAAGHDTTPVSLTDVAFQVREWISAQTFSPRSGDRGVHVVDAESAAFGDFDEVQLAGLVEGEWPQRPRRGIFYSASLLKSLGWPHEADRLSGERALFRDLLRLPSGRLVVSAFQLEDDAIVPPSGFTDELAAAGLERRPCPESPVRPRVFEEEALLAAPMRPDVLEPVAASWAALRDVPPPDRRAVALAAEHDPATARAWSLSALERYQNCPFQFFAVHILRLEEPAEDQSVLNPRLRGQFIHTVFQRFFEAWDARGEGAITPEQVDAARAVFVNVAETLLATLPASDAALERASLFGSPASMGAVDVLLGLEAERTEPVIERRLEWRLEGDFALGAGDGRRAALKGVIDRVDLLPGRRLRVIDYKSGRRAIDTRRALQAPIYALAAAERLGERDGLPWTVEEAGYISLLGRKAVTEMVKGGDDDAAAVLSAARDRVFDALDGINQGRFPPRPAEASLCAYCAYAPVCRKDFIDEP